MSPLVSGAALAMRRAGHTGVMLENRRERYDLDDDTWLEPADDDPGTAAPPEEGDHLVSDARGRRWRVRRRGDPGFGPSPAIALLVLALLVVAVLAWASFS